MATLPDIYSLGPRPVARPSRGMAQIGSADAVGRAVEGLGGAVTNIGNVIFDRETTAMATERDVAVATEIRNLLYDPESGFTGLQGRAAVDQAAAVMERIDALQTSAVAGLNATAARKLQDSLRQRLDQARNAVNGHTMAARDQWLAGADAARQESALQDAIANPGATAESIGRITQSVQARALREGWDAERTAVELQAATSEVYVQQISRIASSDPVAAMTYLRENEANMRPSDIAALEAQLQPAVRERVGRDMGAAAAIDGVSPSYLSSIRAAESGGNDAAANPNSSALGRYQFTSGTWLEMMNRHPELGLTATGRTDPAQQEKAIRAFTADNAQRLAAAGIAPTGGNLYAAHFLGAGGAVSVLGASNDALLTDLLPPAVISANGFLNGMTVADFKTWAAGKGGEGLAYSPGGDAGMQAILAEPDPVIRAAAIREYELQTAVIQGARKAELAAAQNTVWQHLEAGGRVSDLPLEARQALGQDAMTALHSYERMLAAGDQVTTDPAAYLELRTMAGSDPAAFRNANLMEYVDKLSPTDFQEMVVLQTAAPAPTTGPSVATMRSEADPRLRAAGITENDSPELYAQFQTNLIRWASANPEAAADPVQRDAYVARQMVPIALGGIAIRRTTTPAFAVNFDRVPADVTDDMTVDELRGEGLRINDTAVSDATIEIFRNGFIDSFSREPTAREIVEGLIASGLYDQ